MELHLKPADPCGTSRHCHDLDVTSVSTWRRPTNASPNDLTVTEEGADPRVFEAPTQSPLQRLALEEGLEHHEPGEGSQLRALIIDSRQRAGRLSNVRRTC